MVPPYYGDQKSCSTRREISSPVYSNPFSQRTGHNFPPGHRNRLCDHNSESALRDDRQGAGFTEFRSRAKIPPRSVCYSTPTVVPFDRTGISVRTGVDRALVSRNSVPGPKFHPGACVIVHRQPYPSIGRGYLSARRVGTARKAPIRNRHFDPVGKRSHSEISGPAQNSSAGAWSWAVDAIAYGHLFAQTGITFRSVIGIAYKTTIRNRHSETSDARLLPKAIRCHFGVEKPSFRTPKLRF
ncbi:hypothetical protein Taro_020032 [Colocasia esculenta]|uniref:Uncharacterized protein n=1 Tax=Colocasia esculenta TaxID=4460 RepID=A0A843UMK7_COLES|nr:hypothetical protein [Colocasia esculenta]